MNTIVKKNIVAILIGTMVMAMISCANTQESPTAATDRETNSASETTIDIEAVSVSETAASSEIALASEAAAASETPQIIVTEEGDEFVVSDGKYTIRWDGRNFSFLQGDKSLIRFGHGDSEEASEMDQTLRSDPEASLKKWIEFYEDGSVFSDGEYSMRWDGHFFMFLKGDKSLLRYSYNDPEVDQNLKDHPEEIFKNAIETLDKERGESSTK